MKMIYLMDYWLPFPYSEYGGVHAVIAESDAECVRILVDNEDEFYKKKFPDYAERIAEQVAKAKKFPVDAEGCGIVYWFTT
jgi:hypothetical protein